MIIIRIIGGLGNQMFQYALGRSLALRKKTDLKLDLAWLEFEKKIPGATPRDYCLGAFKIKENFATKREIGVISKKNGGLLGRFISKILGKEPPYYRQAVVREQKSYQFDRNILRVDKDSYLWGHWNNEKYFKAIRSILLKEFTVKNPPDKLNSEILAKIKNTSSVSLHVRRGDYVSNKKFNQYHGSCSLDYYRKAVEIMAKKIKSPYFFAFSDDPEWVKKNLKIKYPIYYVDNNDPNTAQHEDLRLMSACKHNIIANSSFSWWGAWLNQNLDKIVIAPKKWLNEASIDTSDVIPKDWIKS